MIKYSNEHCEEVARLGKIEGLTHRLNALIKINYKKGNRRIKPKQR
jgi:hypothetical protein